MSIHLSGRRRVQVGRTARRIPAGASVLFVAATAIGLLNVPVPAQADPPCAEYKFNGKEINILQTNGWSVHFTSTGSIASGRAGAFKAGEGEMNGVISGGITGRHLDFTIRWDNGPRGRYTGDVGEDGRAYGFTVDEVNTWSTANWRTINPLQCITPPAAPAPAPAQNPPPQVPATAVVDAIVNGPATLQAGLSGTYVVTVSNSGGVGAPVELGIIFAKNLEQMGQIRAQGGFDCVLQPPDAGITAAVRCTVPQLEPGAKFDIVVQGVGRTPGAGILLAKIGNNVRQKDVTIT